MRKIERKVVTNILDCRVGASVGPVRFPIRSCLSSVLEINFPSCKIATDMITIMINAVKIPKIVIGVIIHSTFVSI